MAVDLDIKPSSFVAVVGPSGAGKTTLLKCLVGEHQPLGGVVSVDGEVVTSTSGRESLRSYCRYVPQGNIVHHGLTVRQALLAAARLRLAGDMNLEAQHAAVETIIRQLGLQQQSSKLIANLSGGQKRRAAIAVELVARPRLLLLDEPTTGLDLHVEAEIVALLRKLSGQGCTVVMITHSLAPVAAADQVVVLGDGGRLAYSGRPMEAKHYFDHEFGATSWLEIMKDLSNLSEAYETRWRLTRQPSPQLASGAAGVVVSPRRRTHITPGRLRVLTVRQGQLVLQRGKRFAALLVAAPLVLAWLAVWIEPRGFATAVAAADGTSAPADPGGLMTTIAICCSLMGISLTQNDIVQEFDILRRDWRVGVSATVVILSKAIVFGSLAIGLALILCGIYIPFRQLPGESLPPFAPFAALLIPAAAVAFASCMFGMLISSSVRSGENAVMATALFTALQFFLSGASRELTSGLQFVTLVLPVRLGFAAQAAYIDYNSLRASTPSAWQDFLWDGTVAHFTASIGFLALIALLTGTAAARRLERRFRAAPIE